MRPNIEPDELSNELGDARRHPPFTFAPQFIRFILHPAVLGLASVASIILWMPFGFGYYDFPWNNLAARGALLAIAIGFPLAAGYSCVQSFLTDSSAIRFAVGLLSFLIGLYGSFQMTAWMIFVVWGLGHSYE